MNSKLQLTKPAPAALRRRPSTAAALPFAAAPARQTPPPVAATRCPCGGSCPQCAGAGRALDAPLRASMEARLGGASLADVRVHADARAARAAAEAGAHAFTLGNDIVFGAGKFAPHTSEGSTRLAHELVHVVQQRRGRRGATAAERRGAEREARDLAGAVASGRRVTVHAALAPTLQRDGPGSDARPTLASDAGPQLHLDPEIERLMAQHFIRWWLGSTLLLGKAPTTLPPAGDTVSATEAADSVPGIAPGLAGLSLPLPALTPDFFAALPPDPFFLQPDVGALFSPFGARGAPVGGDDVDVVMGMYRRNAAIASQLPDLRSMAPRFIKPLIPLTWRRDIAGALTGAGVDAALKHDFMSPIDVADRAWEGMTGASTTMIPLPSIPF